MSTVNAVGSQTIDPNSLRTALGKPDESKADKVERAGKQFEAILIRQFLGDALKPSIAGAVEEDQAGGDTYRYFITDILSQNLAQKGVFGLGTALAKQIEAQDKTLATPEHKIKDGTLSAKEGIRTEGIKDLKINN